MFILNDAQIQELYSPPKLGDEERDRLFFLDDIELEQMLPRESPFLKINYILLLGYFKVNSTRLDVEVNDTTRKDFEYIRTRYFPVESADPAVLSANQKYKIYAKIFYVMNVHTYGTDQENKLAEAVAKKSADHYDVVSLFDEAIDWLRINRVEIPSYRKLEMLISQAFKSEKERTVQWADSQLTKRTKTLFQSLLKDEAFKASFSSVRIEAKDFSFREVYEEIKIFDLLRGAFKEVRYTVENLKISNGRIKHYSLLFKHLTPSKLNAKNDAEVNLYFICFVYFRFTTLVDYLANVARQKLQIIGSDGKDNAKSKILAINENMNEKTAAAGKALSFYADKSINRKKNNIEWLCQKVFELLSEEDLLHVAARMMNIATEEDLYFWEYVDTCSHPITGLIRKIISRLDFVDAADNGILFTQLQRLKDDIGQCGSVQTLDKRLVRRIKDYLFDESDSVISLRAEFSIYRLVAGRLQKSYWYIADSSEYRPLEEILIDKKLWGIDRHNLIKNVNSEALSTDSKTLVEVQLEKLNKGLISVSERIKSGDNDSVTLEEKSGKPTLVIKSLKGKKLQNHNTFKKMRRTHITTIIYTTARETGFLEAFKHRSGKGCSPDLFEKLIAVLLADGIGQGIYAMSGLCNFSHDELKSVEKNFVRVDTLRSASDLIVNKTAALKIFSIYNYRPNYIHASADGQKLKSLKSTRRMRHSSKYFGQGKGFYADTLLANHVPINVKMASLNTHESHNVFDLLYNNATEVDVDAISTDTHGANRFNFALLALSDWEFKPRYANTRGIIESLFDVVKDGDDWTLQLREKIDVDAVHDGWDYAQRIVVSLHQKNISQSDLVGKLSRSSPSDKSLKALREFDRLLKANYILEYMDDEAFRRYVQVVLNRGEAYHFLQSSLRKAGGGKGFRGKSDEEVDIWYEASRLLCNCIIYFNSLILEKLLERYEREGKRDLVESLRHISPVAWVHIVLGGRYQFNQLQDTPDIHEFVASLLAAAR